MPESLIHNPFLRRHPDFALDIDFWQLIRFVVFPPASFTPSYTSPVPSTFPPFSPYPHMVFRKVTVVYIVWKLINSPFPHTMKYPFHFLAGGWTFFPKPKDLK